MKIRRIHIASPLTLVALSAYGGSQGGGALSSFINGTAINGPLFGARVFLDVADANGDFNGVYNAADGDILADNNGLSDALGDFTVDTGDVEFKRKKTSARYHELSCLLDVYSELDL